MTIALETVGKRVLVQGQSEGWGDFFAQFDGFFLLFCTAGLMFVVASQYARHRRRRKNLDKMRSHWEQDRRLSQGDIGVNPKLRYNAGFWGDG